MTVTRLRQAGFELQSILNEVDFVSTASVLASNAKARTGSYSALIPANTTVANFGWLITATDRARAACHLRVGTPATGENPDIISFYSGASTPIVRVQATATGMRVVVGASTVVATPAVAVFGSPGSWCHVGVEIKVAATVGFVYVYVDGIAVVSFDGTTNTGGANFDRVIFGPITASQNYTDATYIDDCYIDDMTGEAAPAAVPDRRFELIQPNGNGNSSQMTGNDGNTTDNFLLVDEVPHDGDTTYVQADSAGLKDTYGMDSYTLPTGWSIAAVIPMAIAKKDNAGSTITLKTVTRLGTTEVESAAKTLGTDYALIWDRQTTKPGGGAWAQADLDAVEIGIVSS